MAESIKISDFTQGDFIEGFYLVREKEIRQTKAGKDYLNLLLQDDTGSVAAKVWDNAENLSAEFRKGDVVKIQAQIGEYNQKPDLSIRRLRTVTEEDDVTMGDFLPVSPYDKDEMLEKLKSILGEIKDANIKCIIDSFLDDPDFMKEFVTRPASKVIHHPYIGGLLEHTLSVLEILRMLADHYEGINRSMLYCGGFLHDIGKIRELGADPGAEYTNEGTLLGHMVLGSEMVRDKIKEIKGFPLQLETEILHMIISHQGELDWGAPVVPMTREALIVHFVDNMDAKQFIAKQAVEDCSEEELFTPKIWPMGRMFYKGYGNISEE